MGAFKSDYEKSLQKEIQFEKYLNNKYQVLTENSQDKGEFPDWDIKVTALTKNNLVTTFEVKYNEDYNKKGFNTIVIEEYRIVNQMKKPSGITKSKADYYVFAIENDENWYIIKREKLFELINKTTYPNRYFIRDKNDFIIQIFDKPFFLSKCTII
jgi:hypothetical protein